ncbi:MAG: helix-turn-helix domain-containing protein [Nocardioidaceae bacterium]
MSLSSSSSLDLSPLGVLGFSARQESLYRLVLRNSGSPMAVLAGLAGLPAGEFREQMQRFAGVGMVELRDEQVVARPPQEALGRLLLEETRRVHSRADQLDAVRGLLPSLHADHLAASAPRGEPMPVEVLRGGDLAQLIRSLSAASSGDLLWLRPDPWNVSAVHEIDDWVIDLLGSGRRSRAIYPAAVLERAPELIRSRADAGEHVRVLSEVPTRLAVLGTAAALIGERFGVQDEHRLVLRQPSIVASLALMFEGLWDRAMVVPALEQDRSEESTTSRRVLVRLLAGGAKDEQIGRALGISVRTVRRRIADLLDGLGAESRFQAGAEAARRGWL